MWTNKLTEEVKKCLPNLKNTPMDKLKVHWDMSWFQLQQNFQWIPTLFLNFNQNINLVLLLQGKWKN